MEITVILHETVVTKQDFKSVINLKFGKLITHLLSTYCLDEVTDFDVFLLNCTYLACCLVCLDSKEPVSCVW